VPRQPQLCYTALLSSVWCDVLVYIQYIVSLVTLRSMNESMQISKPRTRQAHVSRHCQNRTRRPILLYKSSLYYSHGCRVALSCSLFLPTLSLAQNSQIKEPLWLVLLAVLQLHLIDLLYHASRASLSCMGAVAQPLLSLRKVLEKLAPQLRRALISGRSSTSSTRSQHGVPVTTGMSPPLAGAHTPSATNTTTSPVEAA
jgi:hypothetical protein